MSAGMIQTNEMTKFPNTTKYKRLCFTVFSSATRFYVNKFNQKSLLTIDSQREKNVKTFSGHFGFKSSKKKNGERRQAGMGHQWELKP